MRESRVAVCVATSTLELGIDIGDVDCVVVAEIPWSVSSLLQRIGRGSRRSEMVDVILIAPDDRAEAFLTAMLEAATAGLLDVGPYRPDLSVAVQQTFSGLFQNPDGLAVDELTALLSPIVTPPQVKEILAHLSRLGWIEVRTGRWMASTRLMDLGEKGEIHTNIPDSAVHTVVDVDTGREIGQIVGVVDDVFLLNRTAWKVAKIAGSIIMARRFRGKASPAVFRRHRNVGRYYGLLPEHLRPTET